MTISINVRALLGVSLVIGLVACVGSARAQSGTDGITIVFRFDDYSSRSCTEIERSLIEAFGRRGMCCTFGVIPCVRGRHASGARRQENMPLPRSKCEILRDGIRAGVVDVALHGYSHEAAGRADDVEYSEFSGVDPEEQCERISKGKEFLEKALAIKIRTFIPPWNTYDQNTIEALEETGFTTVSARWKSHVPRTSRLKYLPATCGLTDVKQAVEVARTGGSDRAIIVCYFHEFDFVEVDRSRGKITLRQFEELLDWAVCQKDVKVMSLTEAAESSEDAGLGRLKENASFLTAASLLPFGPEARRESLVYWSTDRARSMKGRWWAQVVAFYSGLLIACGLTCHVGGRVVFRRIPLAGRMATCGGLVLLLCIAGYSLRNMELQSRGLVAIVGMLGACAGMATAWLRLTKRTQPVFQTQAAREAV